MSKNWAMTVNISQLQHISYSNESIDRMNVFLLISYSDVVGRNTVSLRFASLIKSTVYITVKFRLADCKLIHEHFLVSGNINSCATSLVLYTCHVFNC